MPFLPEPDLQKWQPPYLKIEDNILHPLKMNYPISHLNISEMSDSQLLQNIFRNAYWRFYMNSQRIFRLLRRITESPEFFSFKRILIRLIITYLPDLKKKHSRDTAT